MRFHVISCLFYWGFNHLEVLMLEVESSKGCINVSGILTLGSLIFYWRRPLTIGDLCSLWAVKRLIYFFLWLNLIHNLFSIFHYHYRLSNSAVWNNFSMMIKFLSLLYHWFIWIWNLNSYLNWNSILVDYFNIKQQISNRN